MRKTINIAALAIIVVTLAATAASGQLAEQYRAEIPFDFSVGNKDLKAGKYAVGLLSRSASLSILGILNRETGRMMIMNSSVSNGPVASSKAVLKFIRRGGRYDLAEIQGPDFGKSFKTTWSNVRQVTKAPSADTETVTVHLN